MVSTSVFALVCSSLDKRSCCWKFSAAESACGGETADKGHPGASDLQQAAVVDGL